MWLPHANKLPTVKYILSMIELCAITVMHFTLYIISVRCPFAQHVALTSIYLSTNLNKCQ